MQVDPQPGLFLVLAINEDAVPGSVELTTQNYTSGKRVDRVEKERFGG